VLRWPDARTTTSTDKQVLELDHQQYASGRGPCLEAALQRRPVRGVIEEELDAELMRLYTVAAGQAISNASRWQICTAASPVRHSPGLWTNPKGAT
jgi:hypothetical protein